MRMRQRLLIPDATPPTIAVLVYQDRINILCDPRRAAVLQHVRKRPTPYFAIFVEEGSRKETILFGYNRQLRWFPPDYSSNVREPVTDLTIHSGNIYIHPSTHRWSTDFIQPTDDGDTLEIFITRHRRVIPLRRHQTAAARRRQQLPDEDHQHETDQRSAPSPRQRRHHR